MKIRINSYSLFILGLLSIYVSLIPALGETQPLIIVILGALYLIFFYKHLLQSKKLDAYSFLIVVVLFFTLIHSIISILFLGADVSIFIKYLIALIVFISCQKFLVFSNCCSRITFYVPLFFLLLGVIQKFQIPVLNNVLSMFIEVFIPRGGDSMGLQGRGVTIIAPEQSYMSIMVFTIFLINEQIVLRNGRQNIGSGLVFCARCSVLLLIFMINALTGYMFLLIYLMSKISNIRYFLGIIFLGIVMISSIPSSSRVGKLVDLFGNLDNVSTAFSVVALAEPSGSTRIIMALANFHTGFVYPFGCGPGCASNNWFYSVDALGLSFVERHEVLGKQYINHMPNHTQTLALGLIGDYGLVGFLFILLPVLTKVGFFSRKSWGSAHFRALVGFLAVILFFQSGITAPYFGIVIALMNSLKSNSIKRQLSVN